MGQLGASHIGYFLYIKKEIYLNHLPQVAPYSVIIPLGESKSPRFSKWKTGGPFRACFREIKQGGYPKMSCCGQYPLKQGIYIIIVLRKCYDFNAKRGIRMMDFNAFYAFFMPNLRH